MIQKINIGESTPLEALTARVQTTGTKVKPALVRYALRVTKANAMIVDYTRRFYEMPSTPTTLSWLLSLEQAIQAPVSLPFAALQAGIVTFGALGIGNSLFQGIVIGHIVEPREAMLAEERALNEAEQEKTGVV
jgi:hypothetical protein